MPQNAWTPGYQDVIGLCRLAYKDRGSVERYAFGTREWSVTDVFEEGPFGAVLAVGQDLANNTKRVLSFSGSDIEWGD